MGTKFLSRIALVMVLVLTLGMTYSTVAEASSDGVYCYALNRVNVRAEPTTDSRSLGVLSEGEIVYGTKIVSDNTGKKWMYAYTQFGTGYVSKNSLAKCHDYDGQPTHRVSTKTLVVSKTISVTSLSGVTGTLKKGTKVKATRFYPTKNGDVKVQIRIGKYDCRISGKYLRQTNGKKLPSLPRRVRMKKAYNLNGERLSKGQVVYVEFYFLKGDKLYADVHEGIIPSSLLKR